MFSKINQRCLEGIVKPRIKIDVMSHVLPDLYVFLPSVEHKRSQFWRSYFPLFWIVT